MRTGGPPAAAPIHSLPLPLSGPIWTHLWLPWLFLPPDHWSPRETLDAHRDGAGHGRAADLGDRPRLARPPHLHRRARADRPGLAPRRPRDPALRDGRPGRPQGR